MSIQNLEAVSECAQLSPWVTKLTLACLAVDECWPVRIIRRQDNLDKAFKRLSPEIRQEFLKVKADEDAWYPDRWPPNIENELLADPETMVLTSYNSRQWTLGPTLADCFGRMANLDHIQYVGADEQLSPGRYRNLRSLDVKCMESYYIPEPTVFGLYAHIGLEILISAIAMSAMRPHTLDLAVELRESHAFVTSCPEGLVATACSKVHTLVLTNSYDLYGDGSSGQPPSQTIPQATINRWNFPALDRLILDHQDLCPIKTTPLPLLSEIPALRRLVILNATLGEPEFLHFIQRYCNHAERLILGTSLEDIDQLLDDLNGVLSALQLKHLTIHIPWAELSAAFDPHGAWKRHNYNPSILDQMHKGLMKGLAIEVTVLPWAFRARLDEWWVKWR